ncbi:MAG: DUF3365 domain-containing protein [Bacteriovoracia bacterium]
MRFIVLVLFSFSVNAAEFETEAKSLAKRLKMNLVTQLTKKMSSEGAVAAVSFCHLQVKPIAKEAAGADVSKYEFGRSSHKIRNLENKTQDWMAPYLSEFQKSNAKNPSKAQIHIFSNGKKAYLEPLYVGPQCLTCHGEVLAGELKTKISELYPTDQAIGFKLGQFRGLIWIKQK